MAIKWNSLLYDGRSNNRKWIATNLKKRLINEDGGQYHSQNISSSINNDATKFWCFAFNISRVWLIKKRRKKR